MQDRAKRLQQTQKKKARKLDLYHKLPSTLFVGSTSLPGKLRAQELKELEEARKIDKQNGVSSWRVHSECYKTLVKWHEIEQREGYFKPSSGSENRKDYKRISNKKLRQRLRRELERDPESLNSCKNNKEQKNFDYWWTIN